MSYALSMQKFIPQGDSGRVLFLPLEDTSGLPDWLFLDAPTLTLRSGESRTLQVSLRVPNEATPGGHYAAIFLTQTGLTQDADQNVSAIPRIGVLVFATVNGNVVERIALADARVEQLSASHLPARFIVEVENQGNIHVQPKVSIEIANVFGKTIATLDANEADGRILPGSKRIFFQEWNRNTGNDGVGFWHELQQEWQNGGIGWYEARVHVSSRVGDAGEAQIRFQIWPWRSMIIGMTLFFLFMLGLFSRRRLKPKMYRR